jgi:acyl-CoA reductase-like NAD-dependent aldehyde dehydrogenase
MTTLIAQPSTQPDSNQPDPNQPGPEEAAGSITIHDPRTGALVGTVTEASPAEVRQALAAARAAAPSWASTAPAERGQALHRMADALEAVADELAEWNTRETGKPNGDALGGIGAAVGTLRQYAELGPLHRGHSLRGPGTAIDYTVPVPRGVAVLITPWNDPVAVATGLVAAAVVTGNVVVHKPSERCPHLGARLGEVLSGVLPEGVLTTLTGGVSVGRQLVESADVDLIAHVGSSATGREIAAAGVRTGAHVLRENGGNDALLVDADVDPVWAAAQAALGSYANSGQICTSVERIFVHRAIAAPFLDALVAEARQRNAPGGLAPLVDTRLRDEVDRQVGQTLAAGARLLEGGEVPSGPGAHYPATVVTDCPLDSLLMTEETFGPVAPVHVVDDFAEGLRLAATDRYGLAATVLSASLAHITEAVDTLAVGTVKVNGVFGGAPGGAAEPRRDSGSGFGYGPELLDEMTARKVVHIGRPVVPGSPG